MKEHKLSFNRLSAIYCIIFLLSACVSARIPPVDREPHIAPASNKESYKVVSERTLNSDGVNTGLDAYQLIRDFAGPKAIEAPDLYENNHPGMRHIYEGTDDVVGDHFVFIMHKLHDKDRDAKKFQDRQRNEIKAYSGSDEALKAYKNEVFTYRWKFKINKEITVSRNSGHFFQLKAVDGGPGAPILTLSGRHKDGEWLEVIHRIHGEKEKLKIIPLKPLKGKWLQVNLFVNYRNNGQLELQITDIESGEGVLYLSLNNIDMLRGESSGDFVRPKWGIYRSLKSQSLLRDEEEKVFFADFSVQKLEIDNAE